MATLSSSGAFVGTIGLDRRDRDRPGHRHSDGLETANVASTALLERLGFSRAGPDFVEFDAEQSPCGGSLPA